MLPDTKPAVLVDEADLGLAIRKISPKDASRTPVALPGQLREGLELE